jgi:hypothetical protein
MLVVCCRCFNMCASLGASTWCLQLMALFAPSTAVHCCCTVAALLLHCCCTVAALLLHCCCTVAALLLHCCCTVAALLLQASNFLHLSSIVGSGDTAKSILSVANTNNPGSTHTDSVIKGSVNALATAATLLSLSQSGASETALLVQGTGATTASALAVNGAGLSITGTATVAGELCCLCITSSPPPGQGVLVSNGLWVLAVLC